MDYIQTRAETDKQNGSIPFLLAAVSVCDIQAFTENRFAKKQKERKKGKTEKSRDGQKIT